MCPPEHFGVLYEINPWMHREVTVDLDRARDQWEGLVSTLEAAGAEVERLEPQPALPDLVFTANAGMVNDGRFVPSRFRHPERAGDQWSALVATLIEAGATVELLEPQPGLPDLVFTANAGTLNNGNYVASCFRHPYRQPEVDHDIAWFTDHGYNVAALPEGIGHEGAGDALPFRGVFLSGYRSRSDAGAHGPLSALLGAPVRPIELIDPRLYHLDLTFCPPAWRPTASTSTRPWSPSWPTGVVTRHWGSSPMSGCSWPRWPATSCDTARLGAAVPHVPARALRGPL